MPSSASSPTNSVASSSSGWSSSSRTQSLSEEEDHEEMMSMYGKRSSSLKGNVPQQQHYDDGTRCRNCGASLEFVDSDGIYGDCCTECGTSISSSVGFQTSSIFREEIEFDKDDSTKLGRHVSHDEGLIGAYIFATAEDPNSVIQGLSSKAQARLQRQISAKHKAETRAQKLLAALNVPQRYLPEVMDLVCKMAERPNDEIGKKTTRKLHSNDIVEDTADNNSIIYNLNTGEHVLDQDEDDLEVDFNDEATSPSKECKLESSEENSPERIFDLPDYSNTNASPSIEGQREHHMALLKEKFKTTLYSNKTSNTQEQAKETEDSTSAKLLRYTRTKWIDGIICGSIYVVCRRAKLPLTLLDLSEVTGYSIFELGKKYKAICHNFGIQVDPLDLEVLCDRMTNEFEDFFLNTNGNVDMKKKTDVNLRMRRIIRVAIKECLDTGRRPVALVGAALIMAMQSCSIKLTCREVAEFTHTGENTIRERYKELKQLLLNLSKELPFHHEICAKDVSFNRYLSFILEHVEALRDLHRTKTELDPDSPTRLSDTSSTSFSTVKSEDPSQIIPQEVLKSSLQRLDTMTKGKLSKEIALINSQISESLPPSFIISQLCKEKRREAVRLAKQRIQQSMTNNLTKQEDDKKSLTTSPVSAEVLEMEKLLLEGVPEEALISGQRHTSSIPYYIGKEGVDTSEELTDMDMSQQELNSMIRSKEEVEIMMAIRSELGDDVDAELSIKQAQKKRKKEEEESATVSSKLMNPSKKNKK
ncbi:hypothetical protein FDP41_002864 [Naegleria fowleri]|uniref:Transcription factor TFIIB cyclin-like domain-containing protein n=1 Tax=Naegleria fowleri TaxID=5763 RepID=A0A6A5BZE5_NAEFO|nr:uncharacterized protein FDP41_002864 [Naegleria fowleri]KAF0978349.1 hypothetical protein FDP41_002864 [Naegleria fowleri]CAG4719133.1 unnamed protein product [Naegleria fowleri]